MIVTLTSAEMLRQWQTSLGMLPARDGLQIIRTDGVDTDAVIRRAMRLWYAQLLRSADPALLPVSDIAAELVPHTDASGYLTIDLPDSCVRLLSVKLFGWLRPAAPLAPAHADAAIGLLASPYGAPGPAEPLAIALPGRVMCLPAIRPQIIEARAVCDPGEEVYTLDDSLLSTIPTTI